MERRELRAEWQVNRSYPVQLAEQLAENIRWSISTGRLRRGERLPSVRALARELQVSVHTARAAYKLLESESLVVTRPQHGTMVIGPPDNGLIPTSAERSEELMVRAIAHGLAQGKSADELRELFEQALVRLSSRQEEPRIVFIECSDIESRYLGQQLAAALDINVDPIVLTELGKRLAERQTGNGQWQALVTTFFHYGTVLELAQPYGTPVFGVVLDSNLDAFENRDNLPEKPKIGVVLRDIESMQYLRNKVTSVIQGAEVRAVTVDHADDLADMLSWGDAFVVTLACREAVERMLGPRTKPIWFCHDRINAQSLQMLSHYLTSRTS
jgi:DNA-binding transcriptional regulator YhcF (GntR family)